MSPHSPVPNPPDFMVHTDPSFSLAQVWEWLSPKLFYNKILGYRGSFFNDIAVGHPKATKLMGAVQEVQNIVLSSPHLMNPKLIWQFIPVTKENDSLTLRPATLPGHERTLNFQRQQHPPHLSVTDFILPEDNIAFFACSTGSLVNPTADEWETSGDYTKGFILRGLALASAEALIELLHRHIRAIWGFPDPPELSTTDVLKGLYRGARYSFGYPSCPELENQQIIWDLLDPTSVGISLTEGFMMEPEASVSGFVLHHPRARHFKV